ncbi:sugar ABC transporter substrate-binding protein [Halarchaeum grantii]|uniref:Sugar ABC transporter substrate-binding protein n=1 Tax=Halarchaeum grantii TaxID=1193105 RepID=A0A830F186_9EURY|nr:extracellular solute-binding protein [Halarchaeum grantii]GGL30542.1 sugar ABC transporter substrate-binding protein [Halarchaeum grantii]
MASNTPGRDDFSRRTFVKTVGATGIAAGLAGCGGNGGEGSTTTGTTTSSGGSGGTTTIQFAADSRAADNEDAINEALHNAGLSQDIEVSILAGSQVTDNRQQQYTQWLSANRSQPTLLMMDSGWTIPFIVRGQLQKLDDVLPSDLLSHVKDDYYQASVATAQAPQTDALYGVPLFPDFPTMQYRKDLVEDAGYNPESENWATESMKWDEFSHVVSDTMDSPDVDMGYNFQASVYEGLSCCDFNEWLTSWGGAYFGDHDNLFGPIGDRPITVEEEPVVNSLKMVRSFLDDDFDPGLEGDYAGKISPDSCLQWVEDDSLAPFQNGNAVALRNWPYSINICGADDVFGEDLGVMPIPYAKEPSETKYDGTGGPVSALGGWHVTMNPNAPEANKDAAVEIIQAMATESFALDMFGIIGWIPPVPEHLTTDRAKSVDVIGRYTEQLKVAGENAVPRPVTAVWPQESTKVSQEANAALSGEKSAENAMSSLKQSLEAIESSV